MYTPVLTSGGPQMWLARLEAVHVDGKKLSMCGTFDNPCIALPDTGTSFLSLPPGRFDEIVKAITKDRPDCHRDQYVAALVQPTTCCDRSR